MDVRQDTNQSKDETLHYGYGLAFPTLFRLRVRRLNLQRWTIWFYVAGFIIGILYFNVKGMLPTGFAPAWLEDMIFGIIFFLWGCPGFIFVVRKEAIGRGGTFRGREAVFFGILCMLVWWGLVVRILYLAIKNVLGQ